MMLVEQEQTTQQQLMRTWLDALRSGEYAQGHGALLDYVEGMPRHCCLGVADVECFGAKFEQVVPHGDEFEDDHCQLATLSPHRAKALGLSQAVTDKDLGIAEKYWHYPESLRSQGLTSELLAEEEWSARQWLLTALNDAGASFAEIADFVEEAGWAC